MRSFLLSWFNDVVLGALWGFVYSILQMVYFVFVSLSSIVDLCQLMFRKFVGLDTVYIGYSGGANQVASNNDLLFEIVNSIFIEGRHPALFTTFWSIVILGFILMFITTIAGMLRSEYTQDKEKLNSKSKVIKNAGKAIASFVIIPITCFFCLYMGNAILKAVDGATNSASVAQMLEVASKDGIVPWKEETLSTDKTNRGKSYYFAYAVFGINVPTSFTPFSSIIFKACCYNANKVRAKSGFFEEIILHNDEGGKTSNFGIFNQTDSAEYAAELIDQAFMMNAKLSDEKVAKLNRDIEDNSYNWLAYTKIGEVKNFSMYDVGLVSYYYDLLLFDYIVAYVAAISIMKIMLSLSVGVIQRLVLCLTYLFVLPVFLSFMPIDDGASFKKWGTKFTTTVISAYVPIFAMNVAYLLLPVLNSIKFFPTTMLGATALNYLINTAILIAAVQSIPTVTNDVTMMIGGKEGFNMLDSGGKGLEALGDGFGKGFKQTANILGGATKVAFGALGAGSKALGAGFKGLGAGGRKLGGYIDERKNRFNDVDAARVNTVAESYATRKSEEEFDKNYSADQFALDNVDKYKDGYINSMISDRTSREKLLNDYMQEERRDHPGRIMFDAPEDITDDMLKDYATRRFNSDFNKIGLRNEDGTAKEGLSREDASSLRNQMAFEEYAKNQKINELHDQYYNSKYKDLKKSISKMHKKSGLSAERAKVNPTKTGKVFRAAGSGLNNIGGVDKRTAEEKANGAPKKYGGMIKAGGKLNIAGSQFNNAARAVGEKVNTKISTLLKTKK